jgi:Spy/CpxP family protein refolding chaperone
MTMEGKSRTRLASFGILLVVLAAGFVMGLAWERQTSEGSAGMDEASAPDSTRGRRSGRGGPGERLIIYQVEMTPEQKTRVDSIVEHYTAATDSLREEYRARSEELQREARSDMFDQYRALVSETTESIKEQLTSEQVEVYDSLRAEHNRRRTEARQDSGGTRRPDQESGVGGGRQFPR